MKRIEAKKLELSKETLRKLNDEQLENAVGGTGIFSKLLCDCKGTSTYGPSEQMIC